MVKRIALLCALCLCTFKLTATSAVKDTFLAVEKKISTSKKNESKAFDSILKQKGKKRPINRVYNKGGFDLDSLQTITSSIKNYTPEFSWENLEKWYPVSDSIAKDRSVAEGSFQVIEDNGSWVDAFANEDIQELPIGVKHTLGNVEYAIGITNATFNKDYTELTVFARVRLPQTKSNGYPIELFFGANNVKLSHQGGIIGDANLMLLGDLNIPFNGGKWMLTLKGGLNYKTGDVQNKTYVTINCSGVKEMGIQGVVEFSRALILPLEVEAGKGSTVNESKIEVIVPYETENGTQNIKVPYRVKGEFNVVASNWNDLLVSIDLQPFVLTKKRNNKDYKGNFQFIVNHAVLDFSDLRNDPVINFPSYYHENGLLVPNERTWRGVYVNTLEVKLPTEFMTSETISRGGKERVGFGAHHLIIDNYGVSGTFYGDNIFPLDKGRTNDSKAWAYSLDHIEISLAANNFIGAGFEGRILLPVSTKKEDVNSTANSKTKDSISSGADRLGLRYVGLISPEEYLLNVSSQSTIDFSLWKAKGQLYANSAIELKVKDGQFSAKATLHGRLAISASQVDSLEKEGTLEETGALDKDGKAKKELVEFKGIVFQNLVLQTEGRVFQVDYMGCQDEVALAGFPVSISKIGVTANDTNANLYFDLSVNLMGENNGFSATTSLAIIGAFEEENYKQKWKFKGVDLRAIAVDADLGAFAIAGSLTLMKDDPEYGDGFAASLEVEFKSFKGIKLGAKGVFGKTDFRYWQFEAMVENLPAVVGIGVINLDGFSGGASYRMKRTDFSSSFSPTGIGYTPDASLGLGVKAMVLFNGVEKKVFKGGAGFEIAFNKRGGVDFLGFYGQGTFMNVDIPGMDKVSGLMNKLKSNAAAKANFLGSGGANEKESFVGKNLLDKAKTDFPQTSNSKMSISAEVAITYDFQNDVLHGELETYVNVPGGFVQGRGSGGRAGWAVLHFDSEKWYIHLGTPEQPLGLRVGVGPLSIEAGGYFMAGTVMPDSPGLPPEVAEILKVDADELDYLRNENDLKKGSGFAFGTDFSLDTGDLRFLAFYARFKAGMGFDIMLRDYGDAKCANTGGQVGINGWYANGQAYAYLQGELGIRIKLFFVKKKIPIIKGNAAVLLQAKAPNPIWMRGYVASEFSVLGGLVKGRFRFKVVIGKACEFENDAPLGGVKIITDVSPGEGEKDLDVFAVPQAAFSMKVGEPLVIPEDDGDKTYRLDLDKFVLLHNGKEIPGELEWTIYRDRVNFVSTDILPPEEQLTVHVEVSFKEKVNGVFKPIMVDGKPAKEIEERTFTTGDAPNYIPLHNITYAYPVIEQKYFLEDEYNQGYVQLKRGQDYLFEDDALESFVMYSEENKTTSTEVDFKYHTTDNKVTYNLPNVSQESQYTMQIASRLISGTEVQGVQTTNTDVDLGDASGENTATITSNQAESLSQEGTIERLTYSFGTSKYKTFEKKISTINTTYYDWTYMSSDVIFLNNKIKDHEPFDIIELVGSNYTGNQPLVRIEATLEDTYFKTDINPPLYAKYPLREHYTFKNRDDKILGAPPKYALPINSSYLSNLEYGVNPRMLRTTFPFNYNLGFAYKADWVDLFNQIIYDQTSGHIPASSSLLKFLDEQYVFMRYGVYKTRLNYKLPGSIKGTSVIYNFENPNKFR